MEIKHRREYNEAKFMEHLEWNAKQKARYALKINLRCINITQSNPE